MSAEPLALACKLEDLKQLDNKPFEKYPRGFIKAVQKRLPRCYQPTFQHLFDESLKNYRDKGRVRKSVKEIAEEMQYHPRTADRHLAYLRETGFLRILKGDGNGIYKKNYIEVVCPKDILRSLLSIQDRALKGNTVYKPTTSMSCMDDIHVEHSFNNRYMVEPNIKSNIRETSPLDDLEPVNETTDPSDIVSDVPCETFVGEAQPGNFKGLESETFKIEAEVARFITKAERTEVVKKVKAMKRDGEIHANVQANYQDIMVLVQHIIVHCVYRNVLRYKNFKHALNAAAKGLRNGTWTTPKRVLAAETAERERLADEAKERERRLCLDSGVFRTLGEAMRLPNAPSEADIGKIKAQAICDVVQAVGENKAKDYRKVIDEMLKKASEKKNEERKNKC